MADNVAQSIKDLDERIKSLDKGLQNTMNLSKAIAENSDMLGNVMMQALKKGSDESKEAVKNLKELNKTITDTFGSGKEIKIAIGIEKDRLKKEIAETEGRLKKFSDNTGEIKRNEGDLSAYKEQLAQLGNLEKTYARINQIVNTGKGNAGTLLGIARATEMNARKKAIDDVTKTEGRLLKLEQELSRYKEGGSRWKNVKSQIEAANKELEVYREKLKLLASRGKSALDANTGTVGFSKETKQLIQEGRDATREAERLAKVRQKDAEWQEQQRRNTEAQFVANGRAIEQQRRLADQIDLLERKYDSLYKKGISALPSANEVRKQIQDLQSMQEQLDRTFSGSKKAGEMAFLGTKAQRDLAQREIERTKAAKERAAIERKADSESLANQRRQIQIKAQMSAIDKARNSDRDVFSRRAKAQMAEENAEYKRLSAELTRLIARQKELNAISQGSGSRARGRLQTYEITASEQTLRRYEEAWRRVDREQKSSDDNMRKMLSTVSRLASAFGVAFSVQGLVNFGKKLVETRGEFEMQFVAMKQIIGDVDAATKIWNQTMQQALQSPFRAMQLVDYTKKLAAYRIETDKLFDTTKRLADVSAGLGVDMGRLILAYGQVKTANFLRASEVRQFTEAGVNIYGELAKYFSEIEGRAVSTADVVERVSKRMVMFSDVEEIFKRMTDEGGTFFNMQEVQANTVRGQIMKLHDAYDQMLNTIGEKNNGKIKDIIETLNNLVRNWQDVAAAIRMNILILIPLVSWFKILKPIITASTFAFSGGTKAIMGFNTQLKVGSANLKVWSRAMKMSIAASSGFGKVLKTIILRTRQFGAAFSAFGKLPQFALLTAALWAIEKIILKITGGIGNLDRAVRNLHKDLENLSSTEIGNYKTESDGYKDLVNRLSDANEGSEERRQIISKLNSQYGQYLDFIVDETTKTEDLANAYETVTKRMKESAKSKVLEQGYEKIQKTYYDLREEAKKELSGVGVAGSQFLGALGFTTKIQKKEIDDLAGYIESKLGDLSEQEIENLDKEMFARKSIAEFMGIEDETRVMDANKAVSLIDVYIKQQHEILDLEKQINGQLESSNRTRAQINAYRKLENDYAKELKDIESGNYSENEVKYLKEKAALRYEENKIQLRVELGEISDTEAEELRKNLQNKLINIAQEVNDRLKVYVARQFNFAKGFDDYIEENIGKNLPEIDAAIQLYNRLRTNESDIAQGISKYEQAISGDIERQLQAIREILKQKQLGYAVDEEDLNKQILLLENLEKQASLWGIKPKELSSNWINAQTYADVQSKFSEKYGGPTNVTFRGLDEEDKTYTQVELAEKYNKLADEQKKIVDALNKSKAEGVTIDALALAQATANEEAYRDIANWLGWIKNKTSGNGGQKESVSSMLSLLREMNSEYEKLSKSAYGYAKSQKTVSESYRSAFMEIYKGLGMKKGQGMILDFETTDFTTKSGLASAYQNLLDYVSDPKRVGKYAKDAVAQIEKALSQIKAEIDMDVSVRIREDFGRQMEEAFGDYELTLELQKLNIPEDAVKDLFPDFDYTSIGALQDIMEKFYNDRQKKDEKGNVLFSKDDLDAYKKWSDKIDSEILKMRKEKAQQYSRYLEKEYSERAKVEMKYAKDVAFVTANMSDETQRNNILSNLQKKYQDDINELNWKSFKESDFYVEMMEDITSLPKEYTQMMLDKINEILQHPETLSPRALKEAINARQKVLEAQMNFEPLDVMRTSVAQIRTAMNDVGGTSWKDTKEKIHEQVTATQEQIDKLEEEARCWDDTAAKMQVYEDAVESVSVARGKLGSSTTKKLEEEGASLESVLKEYKNLRTGFDEERQQLLIDFKKENLTDEEDAIRKQLIDKGYLSESGELTSNGKDRLNYLDRQNSYYQEQIDLLNELIDKEKELQSIREGQAGTDAEMQRGVGGVGTAANARARAQEARDEASEPRKRIQSLKDYLKAFTNFNESFAKFNATINSTLNAVQGMGNAFYDMFDALGGETDALTDGWKEFGGTMITQITQTLTMIPMMVAAFTAAGIAINSALGIIGLIAEALQLLFAAIGAIAKLHDAHYEKEIENQQKKIDALKDAYDRLEKAIAKTVTTSDYLNTYNKQIQNTYQQIAATRAQLAAAQSRKNVDQSEVDGYRSALYELNDQLEDLQNQMQETFGGIGGRGNYRSWAEEFVSEWRSAFLETGDGLDALEDHFDEFLQSWFEKQATMRIAAKMLDPLMSMIDQSVDDGILTRMELDRIKERASEIFPQLNEQLREFYETMGFGDAYGSLSGLAQAISGMTEEQADILAAYWNSVRMHTASIDINVAAIANALGVGAGSPESNPMLKQISIVASNTANINSLLEGVIKTGHSKGMSGIKVFLN